MVNLSLHIPNVNMNIGVLALQGGFAEHISALRRLGVTASEVRLPEHLVNLCGLIIPGGESTTIGKLAEEFELIQPIREFGQRHAVWGTCAGAIFMSRNTGNSQPLLNLMDIKVERNAFGRQINSFEEFLDIPIFRPGNTPKTPFHAVYIRAPLIKSIGNDVNVLAYDSVGRIVAAQQSNFLATTFHPELTSDARFHEYFLSLARN